MNNKNNNKKKLLIITAGTIAASVGEELEKQMKAHPRNNLDVMVRYIDTAYLPYRYGTLRNGDWFQMNIGERYMAAIYKRIKDFNEYPRIKRMLFPNLLPGTAVTGGGSIRYNGAGAVEVQRESIQRWLSDSMAQLAQRGNKETNISMALIISAVGATGSGSLEHLIEVIIDSAYHARIKSTTQSNIRCDVFILQPGRQGVTQLGLANTLALYAELAASQLTLHPSIGRQYQGRKIMVDWGSTLALSSIDQLREAAATLIRLSSDSSTSFAAEFQEREVDNHVLRELDPISNLPMHLSTATIVTISLGDLVEQVTQRDTAKLIENLVFGKTQRETSNVFLGKVAQVLAGENGPASYQRLLRHLSSNEVRQNLSRLDRILDDSGSSIAEKVSRLQIAYQDLQREIRQSIRSVQNKAQDLIDNTLSGIESAKYELVSSDTYSLSEVREEYNALENTVMAALVEARKDVKTTKVDEEAVNRRIRELQSSRLINLFGQQERVQQLASAMKQNLEGLLSEVARDSALAFLEELQNHCTRMGRNLDVILGKLTEQRTKREGWAVAYRDFKVDTGHPLFLMALSKREEIEEYTKRVSIFSTRKRSIGSSGTDQILDFRKWLEDKRELVEDLFEGEVERVRQVALSYTSERVQDGVKEKTVLDILLEAGEKVLTERLEEAATKTVSLVSYDEDFAPERREVWHISAQYTLDQRETLDRAMKEAIKGQSTLLESNDPTEIAIYYYVDGIPMSAVDDLKGRCLQAFLKRRQQWYRQQPSLNGNGGPVSSLGGLNQRVGVPVYSGQDAEDRVIETGVIRRLYEVKGTEVDDFSNDHNMDELKPPKPANSQGGSTNGQVDASNNQTQTNPASEQDTSSTSQAPPGNHQAQTNPAASEQDTSSTSHDYLGGYRGQPHTGPGQDKGTAQPPPPNQQNGADQGMPPMSSDDDQSKPQQ